MPLHDADVNYGRRPEPGVFCPEWHEPCTSRLAASCGSCIVCAGCGDPVRDPTDHYTPSGSHVRVRDSS